jgi:hypothetical protein
MQDNDRDRRRIGGEDVSAKPQLNSIGPVDVDEKFTQPAELLWMYLGG